MSSTNILYISLKMYCNRAISIDSYFPINKFYSFIMFSLLINAVILLLNGLVLILYIHFLSLRCYFLHKHYLNLYIIDTALKVS